MKKVCLLLPQLLQEIIYTTMERNVVLVRHARFLSHVSALFVLKLIMNVTAALLETLFVIRVKREVIFHGPVDSDLGLVDPDLGLSIVVNSRPSQHRQHRTYA